MLLLLQACHFTVLLSGDEGELPPRDSGADPTQDTGLSDGGADGGADGASTDSGGQDGGTQDSGGLDSGGGDSGGVDGGGVDSGGGDTGGDGIPRVVPEINELGHLVFPDIVAWDVRLFDVDQDGRAEILYSAPDWTSADTLGYRYDIGLLRLLDDGTWAAPQVYPLEHREPNSLEMTAGDLDGDGDLELMVAHVDGLSIFSGEADGTLGSRLDMPGERLHALAAADFDEDGDVDLMAQAPLSGSVQLWLNDGAGSLVPGDSASSLMDRLGRGRGEARDLDFDGRPEFVQTLSDDRGLRFIQLSWMERDSTVGLMRSDLALSVGDSLLAFTTFHTDNLYFPAQVAVLRSSFGPSLSAELFEGHVWVGSSSISGVEGYGLAAADYEGDGDDDIIVDSTYNTVEIYLQQDGYFSGAREAVVVSTTFMGTGHRIDGADIDGDGAMELAMTTSVAIEVVMEP